MAEQRLDVAKVYTGLQQVSGEGMAEGVGCDSLGDSRAFPCPLDDVLYGADGDVPAPPGAGEEPWSFDPWLLVSSDGG